MARYLSKRDLECIENQLRCLIEIGEKIMNKNSEPWDKKNLSIEQVYSYIKDYNADIKFLNDKILELQNSPSQLSPEDQVLLDDLQKKAEEMALKRKDLDNLHPQVPPVA